MAGLEAEVARLKDEKDKAEAQLMQVTNRSRPGMQQQSDGQLSVGLPVPPHGSPMADHCVPAGGGGGGGCQRVSELSRVSAALEEHQAALNTSQSQVGTGLA